MKIIPIKTSRVERDIKTPIIDWIVESLRANNVHLQESDIIVISSKLVSYFEGRIIPAEEVNISDEADEVVADTPFVSLTRKNGIYCANAGVDTSNVEEGYAVLWPKEPFDSAERIQQALKNQFDLQKIAVIISDSICIPGRKGTVSVAIGYSGMQGVQNLVGEKDAFGNELKYSSLNMIDSLATSANLVMGEGSELTPMALICNYQWAETSDTKKDEMVISPFDDMFPIG
ncbi:MAG: coenzyme F420-0:L-glutamate ligase [Candidatus Gracilibacteria bacterium]|nr:coenzyme F420-0:L-glutamate ligase [Candidatus Gracilibacteria bacterium]